MNLDTSCLETLHLHAISVYVKSVRSRYARTISWSSRDHLFPLRFSLSRRGHQGYHTWRWRLTRTLRLGPLRGLPFHRRLIALWQSRQYPWRLSLREAA